VGNAEIQSQTLPWQGGGDAEIIANLTIGSLGHSLLSWLTGERGVHAETLLVVIGAVGGFTAQNAAFRSIGPPGTPISDGTIVMVEAGGERYYFGDRINGYLVQEKGGSKYPLWALIAGAALQAGMAQADMPDVVEMFAQVTQSIGTPAFGIPRVPAELNPHLTPRQALETFWPRVKTLLRNTDGVLVGGLTGLEPLRGASVPEEHWPLVAALVAQGFVTRVKDVIKPRVALCLVMEAAIAMSKVDPKTIPQEVAGA
jgi:hypothetical protein